MKTEKDKLSRVTLILFIILEIFTIGNTRSFAQNELENNWYRTTKKSTLKTKLYFSASVGTELMHYPLNNGNLDVMFPYGSKDKSGNTTQAIFNSSNHHPINKDLMGALLNFEVGNAKHFLAINLYGWSKDGAISIGYGYNLYINNGHIYTSSRPQNSKFIIKPSLNVSYLNVKSNTIGSIDNENKYIYLLGDVVEPNFTAHSRHGAPSFAAKNLDIYFAQNNIGVYPKISIANNPYKKTFHWEFYVAYFLPIADDAKICYRQNNGKHTSRKTGGTTNLTDDHLTIAYNNQPITKSPYKFNGLNIGFCIGLHGYDGENKVKQ
jgi:hypothetical protein